MPLYLGENRLDGSAANVVTTDTAQTITGAKTFDGGIQFGALPAATDSTGGGGTGGRTPSANLLDDYEEGTWTPEAFGGTTIPLDVPATASNATYVKIGRLVTIRGELDFGAHTNTGTISVSGLPFRVAAFTSSAGTYFSTNLGSGVASALVTRPGFFFYDSAGVRLFAQDLSGVTNFRYEATYETNA